jgi:predicted RNA-binding Zn-ribbon protein involved in translation (DUF1610 family)
MIRAILRWLTRECPNCGTDYTCEKCRDKLDTERELTVL